MGAVRRAALLDAYSASGGWGASHHRRCPLRPLPGCALPLRHQHHRRPPVRPASRQRDLDRSLELARLDGNIIVGLYSAGYFFRRLLRPAAAPTTSTAPAATPRSLLLVPVVARPARIHFMCVCVAGLGFGGRKTSRTRYLRPRRAIRAAGELDRRLLLRR